MTSATNSNSILDRVIGMLDVLAWVDKEQIGTRHQRNEFKAGVDRDVTTFLEDPHEIANVLGMTGIGLLLEESKGVSLNFSLRVLGLVPAMPGKLETSGAEITLDQTKQLINLEGAILLAGDYHADVILNTNQEQLETIE